MIATSTRIRTRRGSLAAALAFTLALACVITLSASAGARAVNAPVEAKTSQFTPDADRGLVLYIDRNMATGANRLRRVTRTGRVADVRAARSMASWGPGRSGEWVVWQVVPAENGVVVLMNTVTGAKRVVPGDSWDGEPAVWRNRVVFTRQTGDTSSIWTYDITTGNSRKLTAALGWETHPDIYRNLVVFSLNGDIVGYDLHTGRTRTIVSRPGTQESPSIDGRYVVYADWSKGLADLRIRDLGTGRDRLLVAAPGVQTAPSLSGRMLAYEQYPESRAACRVIVTRIPYGSRGIPKWTTRARVRRSSAGIAAVRSKTRSARGAAIRRNAAASDPTAAVAEEWLGWPWPDEPNRPLTSPDLM